MKYLFDGFGFYPYAMRKRYEESGSWPESGVDVDEDTRNQFALSQPPSGKVLGKADDGHPAWVEPPPPSLEERKDMARGKRDAILNATSWVVERHRDELSTETTTTLTSLQFDELQSYRQQLRDWPAQPGWPDIDMPPSPDWLAELKK